MAERINTEKAPVAIGPYSQATVAGNLVFTSGQIPLVPETGIIEGGDIKEQTHRACKNLAEVLQAAGSSLNSAVKTVCYLSDMNNFAAFNEVYAEYFTNKPARSCIAVKSLPKGALVEIEVIAEKE